MTNKCFTPDRQSRRDSPHSPDGDQSRRFSRTLDERLRYERRLVAAIRAKMDAICNAQIKNASCREAGEKPSRTSRKSVERLKTEVSLLLKSTGLQPFTPPQGITEASKEEKIICRLDFDAYFFVPVAAMDDDTRQTSQIYSQTLTEHNDRLNSTRRFSSSPDYSPDRYDIFSSAAWQDFAQYPNFLNTVPRLKRQLAHIGLPPGRVQDLNHYDFIHLMYSEMRRTHKPLYEPTRTRNLMLFAECYGDQYRNIMNICQYTPEYIEKNLIKMSYGRLNDEQNIHHNINICNLSMFEQKHLINDVGNTCVIPKEPYHRSLHFPQQFKLPANTVFYGGYDPIFQIRRNFALEREYNRRHYNPNLQLPQALKNALSKTY